MALGDRTNATAIGIAVVCILIAMITVLFFPVNCAVARNETFCSSSDSCSQGA